MASLLRQSLRVITACILVTIFAVPQSLLAQAHLVSPSDLQQQLLVASQSRRNNLETVQRFLSSATAEKAMRSLHADARQVTSAISSLSDQELAQMAARANKAQADFAAGNITDHDLLIILIAVLVLILIIVAVRH
ncbi:MAG: PA2779 family protein [Candidatus Angelobacter sp.]